MLNKYFSNVKIIDYDCGLFINCGRPQVSVSILARQIGGSAIAINVDPEKIAYSTTGKSILMERPHSYEAVRLIKDYLQLCVKYNCQIYCNVDESKNNSVILFNCRDDLLTLVHK